MTLYHYLYYYCHDNYIIDIVLKHEPVKNIKNSYLLTAIDYNNKGMERFIN